MDTTIRHERALREKGIRTPALVNAYNQALTVLEERIPTDAFASTYNRLYKRTRPDGLDVLAYEVPGHELDFTMAVRAFSDTPRLLLKVPEKRRESSDRRLIIESRSRHPMQTRLDWHGQALPENAVLEFPNIEGLQANVEDRPEQHWSGVRPGEYVIVGYIYNLMPQDMREIFSRVFPSFSEKDQDLFRFYEEHAAVEDLRDILLLLTDRGYSNFYNTKQSYINSSEPIVAGGQGSGFRKRSKDRELCAAMFIPGDIRINTAPREEITGGGFAAQIITVDKDMTSKSNRSKVQPVRPLKSEFAQANYFIDNGDSSPESDGIPVPRLPNSLLFRHGHPVRRAEFAVAGFLERVGEINAGVRLSANIPSFS